MSYLRGSPRIGRRLESSASIASTGAEYIFCSVLASVRIFGEKLEDILMVAPGGPQQWLQTPDVWGADINLVSIEQQLDDGLVPAPAGY